MQSKGKISVGLPGFGGGISGGLGGGISLGAGADVSGEVNTPSSSVGLPSADASVTSPKADASVELPTADISLGKYGNNDKNTSCLTHL